MANNIIELFGKDYIGNNFKRMFFILLLVGVALLLISFDDKIKEADYFKTLLYAYGIVVGFYLLFLFFDVIPKKAFAFLKINKKEIRYKRFIFKKSDRIKITLIRNIEVSEKFISIKDNTKTIKIVLDWMPDNEKEKIKKSLDDIVNKYSIKMETI